MKIFISLFLLALFSSHSLAAGKIYCENPQSMQEMRVCQQESLEVAKKSLQEKVAKHNQELQQLMGDSYAAKFKMIQSDWEKFVNSQCQHKRELSGKGSAAGIEYMSCKIYFFKRRIHELDRLYSRP